MAGPAGAPGDHLESRAYPTSLGKGRICVPALAMGRRTRAVDLLNSDRTGTAARAGRNSHVHLTAFVANHAAGRCCGDVFHGPRQPSRS